MTSFLIAIALLATAEGPTGLPPSDLPAYLAALREVRPIASRSVSFRDLWDRPDAFRGKFVRVEGRLVRRFSAPASGELPGRVEAWIATDSGDLICLVFPREGAEPKAEESEHRLGFEGTSLGRIRYESGDAVRMAPLIVGPAGPKAIKKGVPGSSSFSSTDWALAGTAAALAALVLARARSRRPGRPRPEAGPPVEFDS